VPQLGREVVDRGDLLVLELRTDLAAPNLPFRPPASSRDDKRHVGGGGVDINNIWKRNSASGPELYSPVSFPANFCRSAGRPVSQQSHRAVRSAMDREGGDDANFEDND